MKLTPQGSYTIKLTFHSIVRRDIQEVCGKHKRTSSSRLCSAEVCRGALGRGCSIDFLPDAKHLSGVEKSAFADILGKAAWSST